MDRRWALAPAKVDDHGVADDDPDELGVFAAERYFYGDDEALWCERSLSSLSSSAFRTGTLDHDRSVVPTAATTSSEASWNSRSALLRNNEPPPPPLRSPKQSLFCPGRKVSAPRTGALPRRRRTCGGGCSGVLAAAAMARSQ